tara:strand:- start:50 stop:316 length:267 start_codon:yes stop_codon:yes gene_type:complete
MRESLSIGKLHFSNEFFSTTADVKTVKDQIEGELRNFCVLVEAAKTPFGAQNRVSHFRCYTDSLYFVHRESEKDGIRTNSRPDQPAHH